MKEKENQKKKEEKQQDKKRKRLVIVDSDALLYRAYYALPPLKTNNGTLINAVYGFLTVFLKAIKEFHPDFIAAAFDFPGPTFRHKKFKEYKAKRLKTPEDLRQQFPKIKEILENFKIPIFEKKEFEADDIIGTIVKTKKQTFPDLEIIILSGDLDLLSLVDKNTKVLLLKRGTEESFLYDEKKVEEKYQGLKPKQLPDFKGLRGDPSDNIPGVSGIGEKTAIFLIKKFGSLENLYNKLKTNSQEIKDIKQSLRKKLLEQEEQAFASKKLSEICFNAPVDFDLKKCLWGQYDKNKIKEIFEKYQFKTLLKRLSCIPFF